MVEIKVFQNPEFGEVRTIPYGNDVWFVAADVCKALDLPDTHKALERLDDDEKGRSSIPTPGGAQMMSVVSEAGLYSLVLGSRKKEAKAFKRWITHDVVPDIRRHGLYATAQTVEQMLSDPDTMIQTLTALKKEREENARLEAEKLRLQADNSRLTVQNEINAPKAEYFDELVDRKLNLSFTVTAKEFGIGPKAFIEWLIARRYIFRQPKTNKLMPYQHHVNAGLFTMKECYNETSTWSGSQTLVTPKGRETFRLLLVEDGIIN